MRPAGRPSRSMLAPFAPSRLRHPFHSPHFAPRPAIWVRFVIYTAVKKRVARTHAQVTWSGRNGRNIRCRLQEEAGGIGSGWALGRQGGGTAHVDEKQEF